MNIFIFLNLFHIFGLRGGQLDFLVYIEVNIFKSKSCKIMTNRLFMTTDLCLIVNIIKKHIFFKFCLYGGMRLPFEANLVSLKSNLACP